MILGIGTDLMQVSRLNPDTLREEDPFFYRTFSPEEIRQGRNHPDPRMYFAARFAGKEALFKALGISPEKVEFSEMEILNDENGAPYVSFTGRIGEIVRRRRAVARISLSQEKEYVLAFAILEQTEGVNTNESD